MSIEITAGIFFVGLFLAWAVVPSLLKKKHASRAEDEQPDQSA